MSVSLLKSQLLRAQLAQQKEIHNDQMSLRRDMERNHTESSKYIAELNAKNSNNLKILDGQNALSQIFHSSLSKIVEQNNIAIHSVAMKMLDFQLGEISANNELERKKDFEAHKAKLLQLVSQFEELPKNHPHYEEIQTKLEYELKKQLAIEIENHKHNLKMSEKNMISEDDVRRILRGQSGYRPDDDY